MPFFACTLKKLVPVVPLLATVVVVTVVGKLLVVVSFAVISTRRSLRFGCWFASTPFAIAITRLLLMAGGGGGGGGGTSGAGGISTDRCPSPPPPTPASFRALLLLGCTVGTVVDRRCVVLLTEHATETAVAVVVLVTMVQITGDGVDGEIGDATVPKVVDTAAPGGTPPFLLLTPVLWWKNS